MRHLILACFCLCLFSFQATVAQQSTSSPETEKQRKDREKQEEKAREEAQRKEQADAKAKEKADKEAAKEAHRSEKRERQAYLFSPARIQLSTSAESVGQALTQILTSRGYTLAEYTQPQQVFGAWTPYRAVFTARLSGGDFIRWKVAMHLKYGETGDPYSIVYFEVMNNEQGSILAGKIGVAAVTFRGLAVEDLTNADQPRAWLDSVFALAKSMFPDRVNAEEGAWEAIKNSSNPEDFDGFLKNFPNGKYASQAKEKLASLAANTPHRDEQEVGVAKKHALAGMSLYQEKKWAEAASEFQLAVQLDPSSLTYRSLLVDCLFKQSKWDEAEAELRKAIEQDPNNARWYGDLGYMLGQQHKWAEAEESIQRAIKLQPDDAKWHWSLGEVFSQQEKWHEAESEYAEALRLDPSNTLYRDKLTAARRAQKK